MIFNRIFSYGLITFIIISCKNQGTELIPREPIEDSETIQELSKEENNYSYEYLEGLWISDNYFKGIEKNKSIYKHRKYETTFFGFRLKNENLKSKYPILYGFSDHEGGFDISLKHNVPNEQLVSNNKSYNFEIKTNGDTLELYFPKTKKAEFYRKMKTDEESALREILFAGKYNSLNNQIITLAANGQVKGFYDFRYYELVYDFTEGINYDVVIFYKNPKGGNWSQGELYYYLIEENSIILHPVITDWDNLEHEISDESIIFSKAK